MAGFQIGGGPDGGSKTGGDGVKRGGKTGVHKSCGREKNRGVVAGNAATSIIKY